MSSLSPLDIVKETYPHYLYHNMLQKALALIDLPLAPLLVLSENALGYQTTNEV